MDALDRVQREELLRGAVLAGNEDAWRTWYDETVGVLCGRRRLKRCALAAGLLGCYLAGITTMGLFRAGRESEHPAAPGPTMAAEPQRAAPHSRHGSTSKQHRLPNVVIFH